MSHSLLTTVSTVVAGALLLLAVSTVFYRCVNRGLSSSARHQQLTRFGVASLLAALQGVVASMSVGAGALLSAAAVSLAWWVTYPLLYHLSNRRVSPDYDNYMDIPAGMYLFVLLAAVLTAGSALPAWPAAVVAVVVAALEWAVAAVVVVEWGYYIMYRQAIDVNGMTILQSTNRNEIIEFSRSYPAAATIAAVALVAATAVATAWVNVAEAVAGSGSCPAAVAAVEAAVAVAMAWFIFKGRRSPAARSGVVALWLTVADYRRGIMRYSEGQRRRLASLKVEQHGQAWERPTSVVVVIGESASRDWMSAFTPLDRETTPWLSARAATDEGMLLFPNAYASAMHTVAVLEKALTEFNQYDGGNFYDSCSIVDIAHAAGYKVHWYSNQGHLGAADTAVTLVADTADRACWTRQSLGTVQYDMSLLDFLDEVDPTVNNLIVLHLKGSHFNFLNRYPAEATVWGTPGVQDNVVNYMNSIRYTDSFLSQVFETCRSRFNMQAMVYFSDHGTIPSRRRSPGFDGFGHVRIPLFVWLGEDYRRCHPVPSAALAANRDRYFTNDLFYNLFCGLLDVSSPAYDPTGSLADSRYRFTRSMLTTFDGAIALTDEDDAPAPDATSSAASCDSRSRR